MDREHHIHPGAIAGDDPLDRAIRRMIDVDPSPEFYARLRIRLADERTSQSGPVPWKFVALGTATAILVLALSIAVVRQDRATPAASAPPVLVSMPLTESEGVLVPSISSGFVGSAPARRPPDSSRVLRPQGGGMESVLISQRDAHAVRVLLAHIRNGSFRAPLNDEREGLSELPPVRDVTIEPIVIEPLTLVSVQEGDRP
jgi:hypothetical protein